ncbi:MAG TPA: hypothetical protein VM409_01260, partial [Chloroflexia bacterium]|nr:hypothetical protein [Chloroflexia bacterium]
ALIFSILTLVYISIAVGGHGSHDEPAHAVPAGSAEELGHKIADTLTGGHTTGTGPKVPGVEPKTTTERHLG